MDSTPRDRGTKIDFFNVPDLYELDPPSLTPVRYAPPSAASSQDPSTPTSDATPNLARQRVFIPQGHPLINHRKNTTNKNPIITRPGHKDLTLVQAAKHGILEGLAYLTRYNLEHSSLRCSNIFLSAKGVIKIIKNVAARSPRANHVYRMAIGLEDFSRYPSNGDAVDFLATTTSATSADKLLQHKLL
ncbi:hypothetical protein B0J14DRAFT_660122 [Halenospora varia]|nr:hypothetical protein B0J14DRAFT_660122 [Halenospora varia]